jgi:hypothetical protein
MAELFLTSGFLFAIRQAEAMKTLEMVVLALK